ncbi:MAG TPA: hypothetical protein VMZ27_04120, partial [Candidatus Saccharimonadales bacterium]|nr:hypothetical protein [Candidatus Saccharimonadales bacterium]
MFDLSSFREQYRKLGMTKTVRPPIFLKNILAVLTTNGHEVTRILWGGWGGRENFITGITLFFRRSGDV